MTIFYDRYGNAFQDSRNESILKERHEARKLISKIINGDFVVFADGIIRRVAHVWHDGVQTGIGSFYLCSEGGAEYSGSLYRSVAKDSLKLSDMLMDGEFWFFHHGFAAAYKGVSFRIPCKVWESNLNAPQ